MKGTSPSFMFSAAQILGVLANHGVKVSLSKHAVVGYHLTLSGTVTPAISRLVTVHRDAIIAHLTGKFVCPCGQHATIKVWKRRADNTSGVPTIVVDEHYFCRATFKDLASNFIGWRMEQVEQRPAAVSPKA